MLIDNFLDFGDFQVDPALDEDESPKEFTIFRPELVQIGNLMTIDGPTSWKKTQLLDQELKINSILTFDSSYRLKLGILRGKFHYVPDLLPKKVKRRWFPVVRYLILQLEIDFNLNFGLQSSRTYPIRYACALVGHLTSNSLLDCLQNRKNRFEVIHGGGVDQIHGSKVPRAAGHALKIFKKTQIFIRIRTKVN
jgi:hypothetical protein